MKGFHRHRQFILVAALAVLSLRAFTPDGYMPAAPGSGLLFELCPAGMPAEVMQALAGGGHHHHHGDDGDADGAVADSAQCPIGHMLGSAVAHDMTADAEIFPVTVEFAAAPAPVIRQLRRSAYRSRAPPA